jgi:hypothetical protein
MYANTSIIPLFLNAEWKADRSNDASSIDIQVEELLSSDERTLYVHVHVTDMDPCRAWMLGNTIDSRYLSNTPIAYVLA